MPPGNGALGWSTEPNHVSIVTCSRTFKPKIKDWRDVTYTDGSVIEKEIDLPSLVGSGVFTLSKEDPPSEQHTYHVNPNGRGPTNTINRAELAGILVAIMKEYEVIATDSASCLSQICTRIMNPMRMRTHLHAELIQKIANIIEHSSCPIFLQG